MQKTLLIGYLGKDPVLRDANGKPVCSFPVATTERWKDQQGNRQEKTEWHRVVAWNGLASTCAQHLGKGSRVYIEGKIKNRKWTDEGGVERYVTEIHVKELEMLGSSNSSSHDAPPQGFPDDDNVPF